MSEGDFQLQDELLRKSLEDFGLDREDQMPTTGSGSREESPEIVVKSNSNSTSPLLAIGGSPLLPTMPTEDPAICPYCNKKYRRPRVLDCLHSMCEDCIIAQLDGRVPKSSNTSKFMDLELEQSNARPAPPGVIRCPVCSQETHIGNDPMFVSLMLMDTIKIREYGISDEIDDESKICQACKSEEKAVANCEQCGNTDLCEKCVQAHRDMKMFIGHKVLMFCDKEKTPVDDTANDANNTLSQLHCSKHKAEFDHICPTCEELLCAQCAIDHKEHSVTPLTESHYHWYKQGIKQLAMEAQLKGKATIEARKAIPERQEILSNSYAKCQEKIEEAFLFYARYMNEVKFELLASLDRNRDEKEEYLNNLYQKIDMQSVKLQDALGYTNNLMEKGSVVELCMNRKKVWQQLKLLMHSMPDVNAEVDLDFEVLPQQEFKTKLQAVIGDIRCRIIGIPKETKTMNPLLGAGPPTKMDGFGTDQLDAILGPHPLPFIPGWDAASFTNTNTVSTQQPTAMPVPTGPGTIGMERRMNRNSNGTSYLSGDSGIYSSASDMTISSPVTSQLNSSGMDAFSANMNRLAMTDQFGAATNFRNPSASFRNSLEANPIDVGNQMFGDNFLGNSAAQSKNFSSQNFFGNYDALGGGGPQQQRPRELLDQQQHRFVMSDFPPLGSADPIVGMRSRSSLCTTPSGQIDTFGSPSLAMSHQQNFIGTMNRQPYGNSNQQSNQMTIAHIYSSIATNPQDTFNTPQGLALGLDNEIAVADTNNHRCVIVDLKGNLLRHIGSSGTEEGHVYYPKKVIALIRNRDCRFIVLDRGNNQQFNRLQLFKNNGDYICRLSLPCQIDQVSVMAINKENEQLIIIDNKNLVHAFEFETFNQLSLSRQFSISGNVHEPSDIGVYRSQYYITDYKMHGVAIYSLEGKIVAKFGGLDTTPYPVGIEFSKSGDILVGDSHGNYFHIVVFNSQVSPPQPLHHYRCQQQKVSRCTGLKINSEGNIVTMSRQNSAVIVFNTLFIPT